MAIRAITIEGDVAVPQSLKVHDADTGEELLLHSIDISLAAGARPVAKILEHGHPRPVDVAIEPVAPPQQFVLPQLQPPVSAASAYAVGDRVEVHTKRGWELGEILQVNSIGLFEIRTDTLGAILGNVTTFDMRRPGTGGSSAPATAPFTPPGTYAVGDRVRVVSNPTFPAMAGALGTVMLTNPDGTLEVSLDMGAHATFNPADIELPNKRKNARLCCASYVNESHTRGCPGTVPMAATHPPLVTGTRVEVVKGARLGERGTIDKVSLPYISVTLDSGVLEIFHESKLGRIASNSKPSTRKWRSCCVSYVNEKHVDGCPKVTAAIHKDFSKAWQATLDPPKSGQIVAHLSCPECKGTGEYECPVTARKSPCSLGCKP